MARPVRYEASGAVYHVMARGEGGKDVFEDDVDRKVWLERLGEVCGSYGWRVHAYVLMGNHFHLLLETPEPNLVAGMKWFMSVFSQGWNRRRKRRGHVFQGRDKAVAERLAKAGLEWMDLPERPGELSGRGKWLEEKSVLATLIRRRTGVRNAWVAERLGMGGAANVTVALRRVRESRGLAKRLRELQAGIAA